MTEEIKVPEEVESKPAEPTEGEAQETVSEDVDELWDALRNVVDPELHMNIVDLGLVYGVALKEETAQINLTLTSPGCPYGPYILHDVEHHLRTLPEVKEVDIALVWDPPWGPDKMTDEAKLELGFDL